MSKDNSNFFEHKRIWSEVKDELLGCYLVPYFNKILSMGIPILYVDCFAGKGMFDDGKNGSPLTALESFDRSVQQFRNANPFVKIPEVRMKFIELNHASDLSANLAGQPAERCEVIEGKFEDNIIPLMQKAMDAHQHLNVFLYVDPYGVKVLNASLFDMLPMEFTTAELLINLNSFGFILDYTDLQKMEELKDSIEQMNKEIIEVREEIISLESEVREKYRNSKNISQIENEIQEVKQKLELQELDYESLKLAKDSLIGAFEKMQSSFGPKVNKATQEVFERLTGGKYKEVMVSRDLNITFQDNSSQKMYDWAFLSGGTIEQAYLSLRLAISDLIIQDGKKRPLLLDDVFMQYDDKRAKEGLQFLKEYTSNKEVPIQSLLFTCHKRIIQWAIEIPNVKVIELFSS